ncbi:hypothetical protein HDF15_004853 [Granulicella mallensis]|jgi:hypothetical protein|uniref:Uncharacterized protein n=1 Tax=Granulicella mallensis TaxID=940614 RepID=A0A7W7ZUQ6_9BACT|nr:hypothetical protein [Granulicella mallensis]
MDVQEVPKGIDNTNFLQSMPLMKNPMKKQNARQAFTQRK